MTYLARTTSVVYLLLASTAMADQFFDDDLVATGQFCIGTACIDNETWLDDLASSIEIKGNRTLIFFNDTSANIALPDRDWVLKANDDTQIGQERFFLRDQSANTIPFQVIGNAPDSAFVLDANGRIGLGTAMPMGALHVTDDGNVSVILEDTNGAGYLWAIESDSTVFGIYDGGTDTVPVKVEPGAPSNSFVVDSTGNVGFGTNAPVGAMEISTGDAFSFFRITANGAPTNKSVDITFTKGPLETGELRYNIVDADGPEMRLNADGDITVTGTLTTAGPTCAAGCDRVFDVDYALPSIEDHALAMFDAGHLPNVGATQPGAPVNLTEKVGNILNELEHAHIFIAQQQDEITQQRAVIERQEEVLQAVLTRLASVEGALPSQP